MSRLIAGGWSSLIYVSVTARMSTHCSSMMFNTRSVLLTTEKAFTLPMRRPCTLLVAGGPGFVSTSPPINSSSNNKHVLVDRQSRGQYGLEQRGQTHSSMMPGQYMPGATVG